MRPASAGLVLLALLAAGCHPPPARPPRPRPPDPPPTVEAFFRGPFLSDLSFFPDRDRVLFTSADPDGAEVWQVGLDGQAQRLTDCAPAACRAVAALAGDRVLLALRGDKRTRLHTLDPGGEPAELPGQDGTTNQFLGASPDGRRFYTGGNRRDPHAFDLYEWDARSLRPRRVFTNDPSAPWFLGPVSDDGRRVALVRSRGEDGDELRVRNLATKIETTIALAPRDQAEPEFFDGDTLYFLAYGHRDRRALWSAGPGGIPALALRAERDSAEIRAGVAGPKGSWFLAIESQDGLDTLRRSAAGGPPLGDDITGHLGWAGAAGDGAVVYIRGGDTAPDGLFRRGADGSIRRLFGPDAVAPGLRPALSADGLAARDGLILPGLLYRPASRADTRGPAVIWLHGGPGGEARREYSPILQYLVSRGYVVLALNYRGSDGHGRAFLDADNRRHGEGPVTDVIDARDWLAGREYVDPDRVAVVGHSYGGYLALSVLATAPERFAAGVDLFGPSNWVSALAGLPPEARVYLPALYAEIGDPVADRDGLLAISPVNRAELIRGPLLIIQGGEDGKVSGADTTELVRRVRSKRGHVEYVYFMTEGHGFDRVRHEALCARRVLEFLDRHLRGGAPAPAPGPAFAQ